MKTPVEGSAPVNDFVNHYIDPRSPAEISMSLTPALAQLGYRIKSQTEVSAYYEKRGVGPVALLLLLLPVIGWAILLVLIINAKQPEHLAVAFERRAEGTVVSVKASDPQAEAMFSQMTPLE